MRSLFHTVSSTLVTCFLLGGVVLGDDDLTRRASWAEPTAEEVQAKLDAWIESRELSPEQRQKVEVLWKEASTDPSVNLSRLAESAALAWPEAAEVVAATKKLQPALPVPHFDILAEPEAAAEAGDEGEAEAEATEEEAPASHDQWIVNNLRLHYARWLAQHELYDESLDLIRSLEPNDVIDPASLLFYQSAAHHFLLNKTEGLAAIEKLLENEESIARRYSITAKLMAADLKPLKTDSLDEVARLMDDIERRLRLQRAGQRVRKEEDDVVAKLDKMIEELEKQQQQQQSSSSSSGNSNNPSQPMQDSQIGGASGEGNVDPKKLAARESWGNLPPKERQEALQQITKDLPAHYREAVEEYFRKLARDGVER